MSPCSAPSFMLPAMSQNARIILFIAVCVLVPVIVFGWNYISTPNVSTAEACQKEFGKSGEKAVSDCLLRATIHARQEEERERAKRGWDRVR